MFGGEREKEIYLLYITLRYTPSQEKPSEGKKKRGKKDPNAPKKPLSAYMLWLQENRESIKRRYPNSTSVADVAKKAGELWKAMSADDKVVSRKLCINFSLIEIT